MHTDLLGLLDFEQTLRAALKARDGERVLSLVDARMQALRDIEEDGVGGVDARRALAEVLSRNLALGHEVLSMIRADLADVQRQRNCMGASHAASPVTSCSYTV